MATIDDKPVYQHFKGNLYVILEWDLFHTEDEELYFSYKNIVTQKKYVRPQRMFGELKEGKYRFEVTNLTYRRYLTAMCTANSADYFLSAMDNYTEGFSNFNFLHKTLLGDKWTPYSQLTTEQLEYEYSQAFLNPYTSNNLPPKLFESQSSLMKHLGRLLSAYDIKLLKMIR